MSPKYLTLTTSNDAVIYVNAIAISYLEVHPTNSAYTKIYLNGSSVVVAHTIESILALIGL